MFIKPIFAIGLLAILSACALPHANHSQIPTTQTAQQNMSVNLNQQWKLIEFQSFNQKELAQTTLDLRQLPNAHATVGCNQMNFQVTTSAPNTWLVDNIAMTRMYCQELAKLEHNFAQSIQEAKNYYFENNNLILETPSGEKLKFVAIP